MLIGEKVILRPLEYEDWKLTQQWRNDMFIKTSTMSHPFPITQEVEQSWYENVLNNIDNSNLHFACLSKENGEMLGYFSLTNINWVTRIGYIGGALGKRENLGHGYGKEAMKLLLEYGFRNLNLQKACTWTWIDNPALKTWLALKGVVEGTMKNHYFYDGKYVDVCFVSWFKDAVLTPVKDE